LNSDGRRPLGASTRSRGTRAEASRLWMIHLMTVTSLQKWFAPAKRILPPAVWSPIRAVMTAVLTPIRFSRRTGHWRSSLRRAALSAGGAPIPWYTYPAIDFLQQRSFENCDVLEFGSGQSTLWWSRRARSVLTIEEDENGRADQGATRIERSFEVRRDHRRWTFTERGNVTRLRLPRPGRCSDTRQCGGLWLLR
jgi:hypothetical protein